MPYLKIQTNASLDDSRKEALLSEASRLVSGHLGKDEQFFMGVVEPQQTMIFAGSSEPLAFIELEALGLPGEKIGNLSAGLCSLVHDHLAISPDRIYVKFHSVDRGMWGWNGGTF